MFEANSPHLSDSGSPLLNGECSETGQRYMIFLRKRLPDAVEGCSSSIRCSCLANAHPICDDLTQLRPMYHARQTSCLLLIWHGGSLL